MVSPRWFGPLALALVIGLVGLTEGALRFAGFAAPRQLFERVRTLDGRDVHRSVTNRFEAERVMGRPLPVREFPAAKGTGVVRIFVVGESTAFGYPFGPEGSFARFLELRLAAAAPQGRIAEVINAAAPGVSSEDVLEVVREVLAYEADLVVVGVGQNEFINHPWRGTSVWLDEVQIKLRRTAIHGALQRAARSDVQPAGDDLKTFLNALSPLEASPLAPEDPRREHGLEFFRSRLERIAEAARARAVPLAFMTQASNLRDWKPFSGDAAASAFTEAKSLDGAGRHTEALAAYRRARDLDGLPVRASTAINDVIHQVASERGAALIDVAAHADAWARDGIPGSDLFLDDLHPRLPVQDRIAEALHRTLVQTKTLEWPLAPESGQALATKNALSGPALAAAFADQAAYCARLGENDLAVEHFRAAERLALAAGPDARQTLVDARLGLAIVLSRMGDVDGANAMLEATRPFAPALVDAVSKQIADEVRGAQK